MKSALLLTLFQTILWVSAFSQSVPPEVWLGIRGSEPEVLAQVEQLTAGGEYVVTYGEHCSRRWGHVVGACRAIFIYSNEDEDITFIFHQDSLFRITVFTSQVAWRDTLPWACFCQKYGFSLADFYIDTNRHKIEAVYRYTGTFGYGYDQIPCVFEGSQYSWINQVISKDNKKVMTDFIWQNNRLAPMGFVENCGHIEFSDE